MISSNEDFRILRIQDGDEENSAVRRKLMDRTEHKLM